MTIDTIGFAGAGIMGAPMIANLVKSGFAVHAIGRSGASKNRIAAAGATLVDSLAELTAGADLIITMLPDSPDVAALVLGEGGLIEHLAAGQLFVDMSTIRPEVARELDERLGARGVGVLDAPVSGGEAAAISGALSIMVGGSEQSLADARPALEAMGSTITHVGPAGAGQATKAANQLIVATNIQAVAEAIVFLEAAGVQLEPALAAIGGGLAGSTVLERKRAAFLSGEFTPGFRVALHDKDLGIVQSAARESGLALPVTALVTQLMAAVKARGDGGLDHSALLKLTRSLNRARDGRDAASPAGHAEGAAK
jgi:2-hydroxy-3-oxopropionate reductase